MESLQEIENFVISEICQPMLDCKTFETLLSRLTDYTSYYASSASTNKQPSVTSLPDFKCSLSDDLPRCLRDGSPFPLLLSFSRLAMIITSCHKGVAKKVGCCLLFFLLFVVFSRSSCYLFVNRFPFDKHWHLINTARFF